MHQHRRGAAGRDPVSDAAIGDDRAAGRVDTHSGDQNTLRIGKAGQFQQRRLTRRAGDHTDPDRAVEVLVGGQVLRIFGAHQQRPAEPDMTGGEYDRTIAGGIAVARVENGDPAARHVVIRAGREQPDTLPGGDPPAKEGEVGAIHRL